MSTDHDLAVGGQNPPQESAGSRALQISNAIGQVHKEFVDRGPTRVRTHINEDVVVCLLEGGYTQAEDTLRRHAGELAVMDMRLRLQGAMKQAFVGVVEDILGRRVCSVMSANDPGHDVQVEVLLLAPLGDSGAEDRSQTEPRTDAACARARQLLEEQRALVAEQRQARETLRRHLKRPEA